MDFPVVVFVRLVVNVSVSVLLMAVTVCMVVVVPLLMERVVLKAGVRNVVSEKKPLYIYKGRGWELGVAWCKSHHSEHPIFLVSDDGSEERVA